MGEEEVECGGEGGGVDMAVSSVQDSLQCIRQCGDLDVHRTRNFAPGSVLEDQCSNKLTILSHDYVTRETRAKSGIGNLSLACDLDLLPSLPSLAFLTLHYNTESITLLAARQLAKT